jgi:hypothetical protein
MRQISSLLQGLARSLSVGRYRREHGGDGKAAAPAVLRTSGTDVGRGLGDVRHRVLAARREGHQPGLLHRLGGQLSMQLLLLCSMLHACLISLLFF